MSGGARSAFAQKACNESPAARAKAIQAAFENYDGWFVPEYLSQANQKYLRERRLELKELRLKYSKDGSYSAAECQNLVLRVNRLVVQNGLDTMAKLLDPWYSLMQPNYLRCKSVFADAQDLAQKMSPGTTTDFELKRFLRQLDVFLKLTDAGHHAADDYTLAPHQPRLMSTADVAANLAGGRSVVRVGYASGVIVAHNKVLTAAHVLARNLTQVVGTGANARLVTRDDGNYNFTEKHWNMPYVNSIFQVYRSNGTLAGPALGIATLNNDRVLRAWAFDVESPRLHNEDFAVMVFPDGTFPPEEVALLESPDLVRRNLWLSAIPKAVWGYPCGLYARADGSLDFSDNRMRQPHLTGPARSSLEMDMENGIFMERSQFGLYAGNSGGPLYYQRGSQWYLGGISVLQLSGENGNIYTDTPGVPNAVPDSGYLPVDQRIRDFIAAAQP